MTVNLSRQKNILSAISAFNELFTPIDNYGNSLREYKIDGTLKTSSLTEGANLAPNYPYKHQIRKRIFYLYHPKKEKIEEQ